MKADITIHKVLNTEQGSYNLERSPGEEALVPIRVY